MFMPRILTKEEKQKIREAKLREYLIKGYEVDKATKSKKNRRGK